ncbi:MAG TPA: copper chaperone PCu(A)C [Acetobacteraceae bacterium]|jgi:hypothetical protein|nr:copper chaperone PCu(A)C [Acetobacteraceae bacterium]
MRQVLIGCALALALGLPAAFAQTASTATPEPITVSHAWARATPPPLKTSAAYMSLATSGPADRLIGVSTPIAATAQVHESIRDGAVMKMRPVSGVQIVPGKPATLSPGGYHIMLTGLKQPLTAGQTFPLTLTFEHAPPLTTTVTVEAPGAASAMGNMQMQH